MNTTIKSTAIAMAVAGLFAAQPAVADTLHFNGLTYGFSNTALITAIAPAISENVYAGGFTMNNVTAPSGTFQAWCVSIYEAMDQSAAGVSYTLKTGALFYSADTGKADALSHLASNWLATANTSATNNAAFQLAIWEIVNETSGSGYSLAGGNFKSTSASAGVITEASLMLGNLSGTLTYTTNIWAQNTAHTTQDLAVFAPVPEPGTYAMMLSGLGLMGFVARRRKQEQEYA